MVLYAVVNTIRDYGEGGTCIYTHIYGGGIKVDRDR